MSRDSVWDVVVVGTGMGGAAAGYALARAGRRVLFIERGACLRQDTTLRGAYAESFADLTAPSTVQQRSFLERCGRYAEKILDCSNGVPLPFMPFIGAGTGGSSALYGGVLERFREEDFCSKRFAGGAETGTLPEQWPISCADLAPYYQQAEQLFGLQLHGDAAALSACAGELLASLQARGLHPYRLPVAHDGEAHDCQGQLCARHQKHDSAAACLWPAVDRFGAVLYDHCEALRFRSTANEVDALECRHHGEPILIKAALFILAAGALETPRLLLSSVDDRWPHGLGNQSGLVGKNMMRHFIDLYLVFPHTPVPPEGVGKELAFQDYYCTPQGKFGVVQCFGPMPPPEVMFAEFYGKFSAQHPNLAGLGRALAPIMRLASKKILSRGMVWASIMEDYPFSDNEVRLCGSKNGAEAPRLAIHYQLCRSERRRISQLRKMVKSAFRGYRVIGIKQAENNERIAHVCGTCRFGRTPADSVLDPNNRVHGLRNLFITDSSFFPSSGGTNPALTIAANALRVADYICRERR